MGFQTGLSGLNAASKNLDVIGNNIANANTAGAKRSRAEFSEVIASTLGASGGTNLAGIGVEISAVSQEFSQGNISVTGNDLDIAINGSGFFPLIPADAETNSQPTLYSRAGLFKLDKDGYIVTNNANKLYGTNYDYTNGTKTPVDGPLQIPTSKPMPPLRTESMDLEFNLDARAPVWQTPGPPAVINTPINTYGTALTTYDSQGTPITIQLNMRKIAEDTWEMVTPDSTQPDGYALVATMTYDGTGSLTTLTDSTGAAVTLNDTTGIPFSITSTNTTIGTWNLQDGLRIKTTQYASSFGVTDVKQSGYTVGYFTGLKIDEGGLISARYSNGQDRDACQIELRNFRNPQGLKPVGNGNWVQTVASGDAITGLPGTDNFGLTRSGALEESNVDLTAELVAMMTAQRAYQANVQTIKTQDQALSALTQLR